MDGAGPFPDRGVHAPERRPHADRQGANRPVPESRLLHDRLNDMAKIEKGEREAPERREPVWEYAPAPESSDIVRLEDRYGLFIGGEFVEPKSGTFFPTINPAPEGA